MASKVGCQRKIFPESCFPINFSKSRQIWLVLPKYQGRSSTPPFFRSLSRVNYICKMNEVNCVFV